jgi:NitT/TauT family transport system ATP-binding protein
VKDFIIQVDGISKTHRLGRDSRRILEDVGFSLVAGERISIVGPNGSGKTTLLRILLGVESTDDGYLSPSLTDSERRVTYIPQDYRNALFPWLKVGKNLDVALEKALSGSLAAPGEYEEICSTFRVHIDRDKYPYQLSGGEQQLFLMIRSLLSAPNVMILDEPLSAVDYGRKTLVRDYLSAWLSKSQTTLMIATHDFEEAILLADRIMVLGRNSAKIKMIIEVPLEWPRTVAMRDSRAFNAALSSITRELL